MTTYNAAALADSVIAFLKGITLQQGRALRDNPIAITEGATGAPRIVGAAMKRLVDMPVITVAAADTYDATPLVSTVTTTLSTSSTSFQVAYAHTVTVGTGSMRFTATHEGTGSATSTLEIDKNGTVIATDAATTSAVSTYDVSVVPGDVVTWKHRVSSGAGNSVVTAFTVKASNTYIPRPAYVAASAFNTV